MWQRKLMQVSVLGTNLRDRKKGHCGWNVLCDRRGGRDWATGQGSGSGFYYKSEEQPLESFYQEDHVVSLHLER